MYTVYKDLQNCIVVYPTIFSEIQSFIESLDHDISYPSLMTHIRNDTPFQSSIVDIIGIPYSINRHNTTKYPLSIPDLKRTYTLVDDSKVVTIYISHHQYIAHDVLYMVNNLLPNKDYKKNILKIYQSTIELFHQNNINSAGYIDKYILQAIPTLYDNQYSIFNIYTNQILLDNNDNIYTTTGNIDYILNLTNRIDSTIIREYKEVIPLQYVPHLDIQNHRLTIEHYGQNR